MAEQEQVPTTSESSDKTSSDEERADQELLQEMRQRLDRSVVNEKDERIKAHDDIRFINGEQWDESVKTQRGEGRLCLVINKMPTFLDQIDGDIRQNKPGIKVKAVDSGADPDTAKVIEGIVRYTERNSGAGKIYSYGTIHAAAGGRGAWRILTDYISDDGFEQEIKLQRVLNAYSIYFDPVAIQDDKQDGRYFFILSDVSKAEYKKTYGFEPLDFDVDGSEFANWLHQDMVRVGEYFWKEVIEERKINLMGDGTVVTGEVAAIEEVQQTRTVPIYQINWAKVDGKRILERGVVPGRMFPIVLVWGKQLCVNGKVEVRGIARHAKDAQKLYNYFRSNDAEAAAMQPKQPYLMPDICLGEHKDVWDDSLNKNYPYLPYKVDTTQPGIKPHRETPAMGSSANKEQVQISDSEIKDTIGIQKAALGMPSNEKSGVAIRQRKMESDTGQFAFIDNAAAAVRTTGKIIVSMIPEVFDTARILRIVGHDMKEEVVEVNAAGGIDLTTGRYDVDVSVDASYSTQREEFQEKLMNMLPHIPPEQVAVTTDILFEMQDFARADDIAERIRKTIPPEILGNDLQDSERTSASSPDGSASPEVEQPEQPSPEEIAMVAELEKNKLELEITRVKLDQEKTKLKGMEIDNDMKVKAGKEEIKGIVEEMITERIVGEGEKE